METNAIVASDNYLLIMIKMGNYKNQKGLGRGL